MNNLHLLGHASRLVVFSMGSELLFKCSTCRRISDLCADDPRPTTRSIYERSRAPIVAVIVIELWLGEKYRLY